jgi:hypothetical protein
MIFSLGDTLRTMDRLLRSVCALKPDLSVILLLLAEELAEEIWQRTKKIRF